MLSHWCFWLDLVCHNEDDDSGRWRFFSSLDNVMSLSANLIYLAFRHRLVRFC
ncbi:hypothetical protein Scep_000916 [Stephania cephalantha]|uniref:Uncharacterized protein n=1 Tax=Stephania cephalantha TaxID=152367 RepID=A0AAP0L829_9MAGN